MRNPTSLPVWLVCLLVLASITSAYGLPTFGGETTLTAGGNAAIRLHLPSDATATYLEVSTASQEAVVVLAGPGGFWLIKDGDEYHGAYGNISQPLPRGSYSVYLITDPPGSLRLTLRLTGLGGTQWHQVTLPIHGSILNLDRDSLPSLPTGGGVTRFSARQPFWGEAYGGMLIVETILAEHDALREYRWATEDGVLGCYAHYHGSTGLGTSHVVIRNYWPPRHEKPMELAYFRQSPSVFTQTTVKGFWHEPLPDDLASGTEYLLRPPLWSTWSSPALNQDAWCATAKAGFVMQTVGLGPVELPS